MGTIRAYKAIKSDLLSSKILTPTEKLVIRYLCENPKIKSKSVSFSGGSMSFEVGDNGTEPNPYIIITKSVDEIMDEIGLPRGDILDVLAKLKGNKAITIIDHPLNSNGAIKIDLIYLANFCEYFAYNVETGMNNFEFWDYIISMATSDII